MIIEPHQQFIRRTALFLLLVAAMGAALAAYLHSRQVASHSFDLTMSLGLAIALLGLFLYLLRRPDRLTPVIWIGFVIALFALALQAWVYPIRALRSGARLVDTLPPMSSALLPLILTMIVFVRPRHALIAAVVAWVLVACPILCYLFMHPLELRSARGMDMVVTLGPVMLLLLVYIPFHRGVERRFAALQVERARMQALAERDGLTGLYNRRAGEHLLTHLVGTPSSADALVMFDIDRFKAINDNHGHPVGDEVLRQIARRCETLLRRDDVFARWGGEEFLLLVRGARAAGSVQLAETLRCAIAATPIDPVGTITASFGVAVFRHGDTLASWIRRADEALYAAKAAGRDRVVTQ